MTRKYFGAMVVGTMVLLTVALWSRLPDSIPIHWNIRGEVDGWARKWPGAFLAPALGLGVWLLLRLLPRLDPRRANYERFEATYWTVANTVIVVLALTHVISLATALGWPVDAPRVMVVVLGVMFIVLGNYLPRVKPNWWMGIRTPWTLENDQVWRDTHRLGGKLFVAAGLLTAAVALLLPEWAFPMMITSVGIAALAPAAYSYLAWRRERSS